MLKEALEASKVLPVQLDLDEAYTILKPSALSSFPFSWDMLAANNVASTKTGIDGKYGFKDVPNGKYYLHSFVANDVFAAEWLVSVTIDGEAISVDLFNANADVHNYRD